MLLKLPNLCAECLGACCKRLGCEYLGLNGCSDNNKKDILCTNYPLRMYYSETGQEKLTISTNCLIEERPLEMQVLLDIVHKYNSGDTKFKVEKDGVYFES